MTLRTLSSEEWLAELDRAIRSYRQARAERPAERTQARAAAFEKLKALGVSTGDAQRYLGTL